MKRHHVLGGRDDRIRANGGGLVVKGGVDKILSRKCIGWGHLGSRSNFPYDVKVLEE